MADALGTVTEACWLAGVQVTGCGGHAKTGILIEPVGVEGPACPTKLDLGVASTGVPTCVAKIVAARTGVRYPEGLRALAGGVRTGERWPVGDNWPLGDRWPMERALTECWRLHLCTVGAGGLLGPTPPEANAFVSPAAHALCCASRFGQLDNSVCSRRAAFNVCKTSSMRTKTSGATGGPL